jgi:hypothetical protein
MISGFDVLDCFSKGKNLPQFRHDLIKRGLLVDERREFRSIFSTFAARWPKRLMDQQVGF